MAFQTSSGSSEASSSTASASSSSATPNDSGGSNSLSPGSSIPFSFLIAFIALFLFFLGCGLGTRRVAFALRRGFGLEVQDPGVSTRRRSRVELTRPILWDILPKVVEGEFSGKWRHLHPLSASYIRQTSEECHEPQSQLSIHNRMSNLSPNAAPSPPQPQEHSLTAGFFPSRAGRVGRTLTQASVAMHYTPPLQSPSQSPLRPTVTRDRLSSTRPPALPNSIVNSNGNGGRNANATVQGMRRTSPSPPPLSLPPSSFLQRFRVAVASHPYTAALIRGPNNSPNAHVGSASTGGDGAGEKPLSQIEGLQVSLLIAMPSPERHRIRRLQAKLELECNSDTSGVEGKGKEVRLERAGSLRLADELDGGGRPSLEAPDDLTLGEFVVGTTKVPWETGEAGVS